MGERIFIKENPQGAGLPGQDHYIQCSLNLTHGESRDKPVQILASNISDKEFISKIHAEVFLINKKKIDH